VPTPLGFFAVMGKGYRCFKKIQGWDAEMKRKYWFMLVDFFVGVVLFVLGLYLVYVVGDFQLGFEFVIVGAVFCGVLLAVAMFYVARVYVKILRDAHEF
jgi:hypothetical protein